MSLSFRGALAEDVPAVARLAHHSFPTIGRSLPEWERALRDQPRGGVGALWVGEEDGELVASCQLLRLQQWIGGATYPTMGLATVAIAPTHRRRGIAARLVAAGLRHARDRGDLASALYPFRTGFYRRLGYHMAGEALQYRLPPEALPDAPERERVRLVSGQEDRDAVRAVYDAWAPLQTGQMVRPERAWEPVWEGGREGALCRGTNGEPEGYAVFRYHASVPGGGRAVEVEEIAWLTPAARRGLHGWLSSLGDQWDQVLYRAHPDEGFAGRLRELRFPAADTPRWHYWFPAAVQMQGPMFRLLDVEAALSRRRVAPNARLTVGLELTDEQIPENGGAWRLRLEDGRIGVARGAGESDLSLRLDVAVLSRLFIGALSPSAAAGAELAEVDRAERLPELDLALRLPRPWTFDRF